MFRVVTEGSSDKPFFWVLCDSPKCDSGARADVAVEVDQASSQQGFLQAVIQSGWRIALEGQFCPKHNPTGARQLIQVAKTMPGILQPS